MCYTLQMLPAIESKTFGNDKHYRAYIRKPIQQIFCNTHICCYVCPELLHLIIQIVVLEPSPLYDNNHYHEECLRCNSCGLNLTGPNQKRARRFKNQILCDLHFADVALMECSDFMQQLRSFKPQSLGCAVARRKSSTTLIFPLPPQACCGKYICYLPKMSKPFLQVFANTFMVYVHGWT